ncbi:hypothetical protein B0H21DRAFT_821519 [Amylocystis lapponica]|nr:hypothetical protein B0H21DRAFT_821519 [Amylocystis lapponica]
MISIVSAVVLLGSASAAFAGVARRTIDPSCPTTSLATFTETITIIAPSSTSSYTTTITEEVTNYPIVTTPVPVETYLTTVVTGNDGSPTTEVITSTYTTYSVYTNFYDEPRWDC